MIYSLPKQKTTDLLERCNFLSIEDRENELLLYRLKNEAEELVARFGSDPAAYQALGFVYAIMNRHELVREIFQKALRKFPNDFGVNVNYAACLNQLGFPEEAIVYAQKAHALDKSNLFALHILIHSYEFSAQFQQARQWYPVLEKMEPQMISYDKEALDAFCDLFARANIEDISTQKVMQFALAVLRKYRIKIGHNLSYADHINADEETEWLTRILIIRQMQKDIMDLNIELAEQLAQEEDLGRQLKGKFIVRYVME